MAVEQTGSGIFTGRRRLFVAVFCVLCLVLLAGYYLFLRTDYAILYTDMKPADASAIVAELDAKGIPHRLSDNGATILVPTDQTDNVRLAVAGSDIPLKGSVGFELFNKSDMGLTDFAQKINYQRALQGEIARTIMMMDAIESARVHLAIPERSLFRANRSPAKAAVEVITKLGRPLTPDRVAGIQQLVASAVPDLSLGEVVILDGDGRIISQAATTQAVQTPEVEEQAAAQNYYSARAKAALAKLMPGMQFGVRTLLLPTGASAASSDGFAQGEAAALPVPGSTGGSRNFQMRITVLTLAALDAEDQGLARNAVASAVGLDEQRGDNLAFETGPIDALSPAPALSAAPTSTTAQAHEGSQPAASLPGGTSISKWWSLALIAIFAAIAIAVLVRARQPLLSAAERRDFVDRIRRQLGTAEVDDARL